MKVKILSLILAAGLLLSLCSCAAGGKTLELTVGVLSAPDCFDPLFADGDAEYLIAANCFEGLMRFEADGTLEPAGCVAYSVNGKGLSYVFKLNPNARFNITADVKSTLEKYGIESFDESITAEDYTTAFKRAIINDNEIFKSIKGAKELLAGNAEKFGVTADGDRLTVTLTEADPDFLYKLAALPLVPCRAEFIEALGDDYGKSAAAVLTNGAYCINNVTEAGTVTLTESKSYNGKLTVMNKSATLYLTGSEKLMKERFDNGTYDVFTTHGFNTLKGADSTLSHTEAVWGLCFNLSKDIMKSKNLRNAIVSATNLTSFKVPASAVGGTVRTVPGDFLISENNYAVHDELYDGSAEDMEKAKPLLKSALTELKTDAVTVRIFVPDTMLDSVKKELETDTAQLGDAVTLELNGFAESDAAKISAAGEYDIAVLPLEQKRLTACSVLESLADTPCSCNNESYKKLLDGFKAETDAADAAEVAKAAEEYLTENAVFLPLFQTASRLYTSQGITGIYSAESGKYIYFDAARGIGE